MIRVEALLCLGPAKRQQLITQIYPFHAIFHPHLEHEDLEYEEETMDVYEEPRRRVKRRKVLAEDTHIRRATRSATKETAASLPSVEAEIDEGGSLKWADQENNASTYYNTQIKSRRREIPPSQSHADTPLSIQSRQPKRDIPRSPLQERPNNVPLRCPGSERRVRWASKREKLNGKGGEDGEILTFPQKAQIEIPTRHL